VLANSLFSTAPVGTIVMGANRAQIRKIDIFFNLMLQC
jgi:hypothetical protein